MKTPALVLAALIGGLAASPALCTTAAAPAAALPLESIRCESCTLINTGEFDAALRTFVRRGAQGDGVALYDMAWMYHHGLGVPVDYAKARDLYFESAGAGQALAMNQMGFLYEHGLGVRQNLATAYCWYAFATANGYENAARGLSRIAAKGQPTPANDACEVISHS
jgi:TPR repeat protein